MLGYTFNLALMRPLRYFNSNPDYCLKGRQNPDSLAPWVAKVARIYNSAQKQGVNRWGRAPPRGKIHISYYGEDIGWRKLEICIALEELSAKGPPLPSLQPRDVAGLESIGGNA